MRCVDSDLALSKINGVKKAKGSAFPKLPTAKILRLAVIATILFIFVKFGWKAGIVVIISAGAIYSSIFGASDTYSFNSSSYSSYGKSSKSSGVTSIKKAIIADPDASSPVTTAVSQSSLAKSLSQRKPKKPDHVDDDSAIIESVSPVKPISRNAVSSLLSSSKLVKPKPSLVSKSTDEPSSFQPASSFSYSLLNRANQTTPSKSSPFIPSLVETSRTPTHNPSSHHGWSYYLIQSNLTQHAPEALFRLQSRLFHHIRAILSEFEWVLTEFVALGVARSVIEDWTGSEILDEVLKEKDSMGVYVIRPEHIDLYCSIRGKKVSLAKEYLRLRSLFCPTDDDRPFAANNLTRFRQLVNLSSSSSSFFTDKNRMERLNWDGSARSSVGDVHGLVNAEDDELNDYIHRPRKKTAGGGLKKSLPPSDSDLMMYAFFHWFDWEMLKAYLDPIDGSGGVSSNGMGPITTRTSVLGQPFAPPSTSSSASLMSRSSSSLLKDDKGPRLIGSNYQPISSSSLKSTLGGGSSSSRFSLASSSRWSSSSSSTTSSTLVTLPSQVSSYSFRWRYLCLDPSTLASQAKHASSKSWPVLVRSSQTPTYYCIGVMADDSDGCARLVEVHDDVPEGRDNVYAAMLLFLLVCRYKEQEKVYSVCAGGLLTMDDIILTDILDIGIVHD